ncbi:MAG: hypothetical protein D6759_13495 [Chloroflexi bacterium]|nr:MAG: hypothetical protein D6759_13495 [Chloroflexota bacterium]
MTIPLDSVVGELYLVGGVPQPDPPHLAVLTPPRRAARDRREDTLFIFLDLGPGTPPALLVEMIRRLASAYWRRAGSTTAALRHAIAQANAYLLEENLGLPPSTRRHGGITCAVLRGNSIFLAQSGPALALYARPGRVRRYEQGVPLPKPEGEVLFAPAPDSELALGMSRGVAVHLHHIAVQPGDLLLLTGPTWTSELPQGGLEDALTQGRAEAVVAHLSRLAGDASFSALVVEARLPVEVEEGGEVQEAISYAPPEVSAPLPAPEETGGEPSVRLPLPRSRVPSLPRLSWRVHLRRLADWGVLGLGLLADGMRTLVTRTLPEPEAVPARPPRRRSEAEGNVLLMAGVAIAIPILIALLVVALYIQRSQTAYFQGLLEEARREMEVASSLTSDPETAREHWQAALGFLEEARQARPNDETAQRLYNQAQTALDRMEGTVRVQPALLWDYGASRPYRLAVGPVQLFTLDPEAGEVVQHTLDATRANVVEKEAPVIAYRGQQVGEERMGALLDLVWMPAGGQRLQDALLILAERNRLLEYNPTWGLKRLALGQPPQPLVPRALGAFNGKLYILDGGSSQIWRYEPTAEGYGSPESYFVAPPPDLSQAVGMAIDGSIYVLLADGRIVKLFGGEPFPYQISGLEQPFVRPVAIALEGDKEEGAIYVADAGADRIVALSKQGAFIHQIRADGDAFAEITAMAVDGASRTLFLVARGRLFSFRLPPLPEG